MFKRVLFITLLALVFSLSLYAQGSPKQIVQELYDFGGFYPDNTIYPEEGTIQFKIWITARPQYVINAPNPAYGASAKLDQLGRFILSFNVGNFVSVGSPQDWLPGEILHLEVEQTTTGRIAVVEFALETGASQIRYGRDGKAIALKNPPSIIFDSRPSKNDKIETSARMVSGYPSAGVYRADNWEKNDYWEIYFSTIGYSSELEITSELRRQYDDDQEVYGPRVFRTYYSANNGESWVQYPVINYLLPSNEANWYNISFELPNNLYNLEKVLFRWELFNTQGLDGGWGEIRNVVITGYPTYTLIIESEGEGATEPAVGTYNYTEGESVKIKAIADVEGWVFDKWIIKRATHEDTVYEPELILSMINDVHAKAYFYEWPDPNPTVAHAPQPEDGAKGVPTDAKLGWTYRHNDDYTDPASYDLYIGEKSDLSDAVAINIVGGPGEYSINPPIELKQSTEYFWQVVPTTSGGFVVRSMITTNYDDATRGNAVDCPIWSFKTAFEAIDSIPWTKDFTTREFPPEGWMNQQVNGEGVFHLAANGYDPEISPYSGNWMVGFQSHDYEEGTTAALVLPRIKLEEGEYRFSFWMYRDEGHFDKADRIVLYRNNLPNLNGATEIDTYHRSASLEPVVDNGGWYYYSRILSFSDKEPEYLIIKAISENGNNMYLDYFSIENAPPYPMLTVTPESYDFGRQKIGTKGEEITFKLKNIGSGIINLDPAKIELVGDDVEDFILNNISSKIDLGAEMSTSISVVFAPKKEGNKSVELVIDDNIYYEDQPHFQLKTRKTEQHTRDIHVIPLTGIAFEPILYLPVVEEFNNDSMPEDWKIEPENLDNWVISDSDEAGDTRYEMKCESIGDEDYTRIITPAIHTDGLTLLQVFFNHKFKGDGDDISVRLQSSSDGIWWNDEVWEVRGDEANERAERVTTYLLNSLTEKTYLSWLIEGNAEAFEYWYLDSIEINSSDLRRIQGYVSSSVDRNGIEGALVEIVGTEHKALSDRYGFYYIVDTPEGTFDIKASKEGYVPHVYEDFVLGEDKIVELGFLLEEKTSANIYGRVFGSDNNEKGLAGVLLTLTNEDETYETESVEDGYFVFYSLPQYTTYQLKATHSNYHPVTLEIEVEFDDVELEPIHLVELSPAPTDVNAVELSFETIEITWKKGNGQIDRLQSSRGATSQLAQVLTTRNKDVARAHEGYIVYRLKEEDLEVEDNWTILGDVDSNEAAVHTDTSWGEVEEGNYLYAVKSVYTNGIISEAGLSNLLNKTYGSNVLVNVTTNSRDSAEEAVIKLINNDNPDVVHITQVTSNGFAQFEAVRYGSYELIAELKGFNKLNLINLDIAEPIVTLDIELIESLLPVQELEYEYDNDTVVLKWVQPGVERVEFRYDDGVQTSQLGIQGASYNGVMGAAYKRSAEVREVSWYLTEEGGPHSFVTVCIFGLNEKGIPDSNLLLYRKSYVESKNLTWNVYQLEEPVYAPNGFLFGLSFAGFIGIGTDDGIGEPYEFKLGTMFGTFNYKTQPWDDLGERENPLKVNMMLRAYGYDFGPVEHSPAFAFSKEIDIMGQMGEYTLISNDANDYFPVDAPIYKSNYTSEYYSVSRALQSYKVTRNGELIAEDVTETKYVDSGLTDGTYVYSVYAVYTTGESEPVMTEEITVVSAEEFVEIPLTTQLVGNYPNPFNPETKISFNVRESGNVKLEIYNLKGQKVRTLLNENVEAGSHQVIWDGKGDNNKSVGSGMFFYRMTTATYTSTKKMLMLK